MIYDPELTFSANAELLLQDDSTPRYKMILKLTDMFRDAYEDGWLDARAKQLAGVEIDECPEKWD